MIFNFGKNYLQVATGKWFSMKKSSAKSKNVMASPKNFTVGLPVTSDQASLQIFGHWNVFKTASLWYRLSSASPISSGLSRSDWYRLAVLNTFPWPKIWSSAWSEVTVNPTKNQSLALTSWQCWRGFGCLDFTVAKHVETWTRCASAA